MKIGVVTFWWGDDNYGQIAQCFALQTILKQMGHESFILRFTPQKTWRTRIINLMRSLRAFRRKKERVQWIRVNVRPELRDFRQFLEAHCQFSRSYDSFKELKKGPPEADCFICGSDQVWNCNPDENGRVWFLEFAPSSVKKVAYAASFGRIRSGKAYYDFVRKNLNTFHAIGVREEEGCRFLSTLHIDSSCVADPTLLLGREYYDSLIQNINANPNNKKAFCYWLGRHDPADVLPIHEVSPILDKNQCELDVVVAGVPFPIPKIGTLTSKTLPEWMAAIRNAKVFFTNSFHGVVFAIIFHSPFVVFPQLNGVGNGRFKSLLSICGLENRIFIKGGRSVSEIVEDSIDWESVDERLDAFLEESKTYLFESLDSPVCRSH